MAAQTPNFTYFKSGIGVQKSDGTYVDVIGVDGNVDAPVTTASITLTGTSANIIAAGPTGTTNPVFRVDAATASVATGLKVTGAAAAGGLAVAVVSSGTNENLTLDAKGSGTITLGSVSTGNVVLSRAMTGVSSSMTGAYTAKSATAVPATAGAVAAGAPLVANSNGMTIEWTTDAPTHTRPKGSLCINLGGSSTTTRMYVNTDGAGTWTAFTTAA
jgi:hypothetical protein